MEAKDYCQQRVEIEGVFRAFPVAWTFEKADSGAGAIAIQFAIHAQWGAEHKVWSDPWTPGYFSDHRAWVVKKDGSLNDRAIESLARAKIWDGDFDKLAGPPPNEFVLIDVSAETYEGKARYRANWVNPNADEPTARGGLTPADPDVLATMRARFGPQARAIAGGNASGAPPAPPQPPASPAQASPPAPPSAPPQAPAQAPPAVPGPPGVSPPMPPPSPSTGVPGPPGPAQPAPAVAPPGMAPPTGISPPPTGTPDDPLDLSSPPF